MLRLTIITVVLSLITLSVIALQNNIADGFYVEEHFVNTPDGYILKVLRIPGSLKSPPAYGKTVVFIQHGLLCSSTDWLILGKNKAIPYLLADAGIEEKL